MQADSLVAWEGWLRIAPRVLLIAAMHFTTAGSGAIACDMEPGGERAVARVLDSETLALDDGREVRLIGALGPRAMDADADAAFWQPAVDARAALEALVAGRTVSLRFTGRRRDRNGRWLAQVFTGADPPVWVQGYMVEKGHARAYALAGAGECLAALVPLEAGARDAGLGLWANASYRIRPAEPPWQALAGRDRFHLVEGTVTGQTNVRGHLYLNFGADWRRDFTISIAPPIRREMLARGVDPATLSGARVRVRGWLIRRNGPMIEMVNGAEVEVLGRPPG